MQRCETDFEKFGNVLVKTQTKMEQAQKDLETLVGVRTRGIQRALKNVSVLGLRKRRMNMSIYAIADLHLSFASSVEKPMDIYGTDGMIMHRDCTTTGAAG